MVGVADNVVFVHFYFSAEDVEDLRKGMERDSSEALREAQNNLDNEKEKKFLLHQRRLQVRKQMQQTKFELLSVYQKPLRQAEAADKVVEAALVEAASLHDIR